MNYEDTISLLNSMDVDTCYPIFVPSVLRPNHFLYKNVIQALPKEFRKKKVFYVTRKQFYKDYKETQPDVNIVVLPSDLGDDYGLDTTRKFISDYALDCGFDKIFDWDDDISSISMVYGADKTTRKLRKADTEEHLHQIITLVSNVSDEAFDKHKRLCVGALSRITPNTAEKDYHNLKLRINQGMIPRTSNIVNLKRLKKHGIQRDGTYDSHWEDMGTTFRVIQNNGWCFSIPFCLYTIPPFEMNQRTEAQISGKKESTLIKAAENILLSQEAGKYVTYTSKNSAQFGGKNMCGINWRAWCRDHKNFKQITELWRD